MNADSSLSASSPVASSRLDRVHVEELVRAVSVELRPLVGGQGVRDGELVEVRARRPRAGGRRHRARTGRPTRRCPPRPGARRCPRAEAPPVSGGRVRRRACGCWCARRPPVRQPTPRVRSLVLSVGPWVDRTDPTVLPTVSRGTAAALALGRGRTRGAGAIDQDRFGLDRGCARVTTASLSSSTTVSWMTASERSRCWRSVSLRRDSAAVCSATTCGRNSSTISWPVAVRATRIPRRSSGSGSRVTQALPLQRVEQGGRRGGGDEESLRDHRRCEGFSRPFDDRQGLSPRGRDAVAPHRLVGQGYQGAVGAHEAIALALADSLPPGNSCSNAVGAPERREEGLPEVEPFFVTSDRLLRAAPTQPRPGWRRPVHRSRRPRSSPRPTRDPP